MAIFALACMPLFVAVSDPVKSAREARKAPAVTACPDYFIGDYSESEFARYLFKDKNRDAAFPGRQPVQGDLQHQEGQDAGYGRSRIIRNYSNAVERRLGAEAF